jgi:hypothetical protein
VKKAFLSLLFCVGAQAGEYAVLTNGFRIHAMRHEVVVEGQTRFHTTHGTMDVPTKSIASFEFEEYVKPAEPVVVPEEHPIVPALTPEQMVADAAVKNGLLPEFVRSVAAAESAFQTNALSRKGAIGLMQLMPGTAKELGANPHDPAQNAEAGARYLKQLLLKYQNSPDPVRLALAAYNAGPGAVDRYRNIPPYPETQQYVERVLRKYLSALRAGKS